MGVAVSSWRLANAVAREGQLGVVSGTGLDHVIARRLQIGDPGGHVRRAIAHFPCRATAQRALDKFYVEGGVGPNGKFASPAMPRIDPTPENAAYTVLSNFCEVWLAREGHDGVVGINLLEKIQIPNLASIYGAMLAGVDYVLMGAGIPSQIPGMLDRFAENQPANHRIPLEDLPGGEGTALMTFDPAAVFPTLPPAPRRPKFLAIISSAVLAQALLKRANGRIDGFVVERPTAGGHNAPPRGAVKLNERGEPIYGERDEVDFPKLAAMGLPFWLAGSAGSPQQLAAARALGAVGIQVGTAFAFCDESGLDPEIKMAVLDQVAQGRADVFTDPLASPTGFPFKVILQPGTLSEEQYYDARTRICDLGYLRTMYRKQDGSLGYRCPAEPIEDYVKKGGDIADTEGRKCLCNGLLANIGLGQLRPDGRRELPLLTAGDDLVRLGEIMPSGSRQYSARHVINYLLSNPEGQAVGSASQAAHQS